MRKPFITKFILPGALFSLPMLASADATLSYKGEDHRSSFQIADGNMRMNFDHEGRKGYLLYSGAEDKVYMVNPERKEYMELDQMIEQVAGLKDQLSGILDQQIPGMSEENKARMQKMMGGMLGGMFGEKKEPTKVEKVRIERTGNMENISGFTCERIRVINPGANSNEVCVASADEVGVSGEDAKTMRRLMSKMSAIGSRLGSMLGSKKSMPNFAADIDGIPIKTYDETGAELVSAKFMRISADAMRLPDDYSKSSLPSLTNPG